MLVFLSISTPSLYQGFPGTEDLFFAGSPSCSIGGKSAELSRRCRRLNTRWRRCASTLPTPLPAPCPQRPRFPLNRGSEAALRFASLGSRSGFRQEHLAKTGRDGRLKTGVPAFPRGVFSPKPQALTCLSVCFTPLLLPALSVSPSSGPLRLCLRLLFPNLLGCLSPPPPPPVVQF